MAKLLEYTHSNTHTRTQTHTNTHTYFIQNKHRDETAETMLRREKKCARVYTEM